MKQTISLLLCAALLLGLCACGAAPLTPTGALPLPTDSSPSAPEQSGTAALPAPEFPAQRFTLKRDCCYVAVEDGVLVLLSGSGSVHYGEAMPMLSEAGVSQDGTTARPSLYRDGSYEDYYYADGQLTPQSEWGFYSARSRDGRVGIARPRDTENQSVIIRDGEVVERLEAGGTDYIMSPGGDAAVFLSYPTGDGREALTMLWQEGKGLTELGENLYPVAVSDGAKYLYLRIGSSSGPMTVQQGADRDSARMVQAKWVDSLVLFNEDYSEALAAGERCAYWSVQGREAVEAPAEAIHTVLPAAAMGRPVGESWTGERVLGISSFQDSVYIDYTPDHWTLCRLHMSGDGSVGAETLSGVLDWDDVQLSADGSAAAWRSGKQIWWRSVSPDSRREDTEPMLVADGFDSPNGVAISADGRTVYYVSDEGLQAWRDGSVSQVAARGEYGDFYPVGNALFFTNDRALWGWKDGTLRCVSEALPWARVIDTAGDFILFSGPNDALYRCGDNLEPAALD